MNLDQYSVLKKDKQEWREKILPCICKITHLLGGWKRKVCAKSLWLIVKEIRAERLQVGWQISTIWSEKPRWSFMATQIGITGKTETGLNTRSLSSSTAVNIMSGIYNQKCSPQDFYSSQTWISVVTTLWERCESNPRESRTISRKDDLWGNIEKTGPG